MKRVAFVAVSVMLAATPALAYGAYYRSSDGSSVHVPYHTTRHMSGEMAICRDGTHSVSHHHRGTCSHHHGVARWER